MDKDTIKCIAGNDGDLQYWYECSKCGCVFSVDYSDSRSVDLMKFGENVAQKYVADNRHAICPGCNILEDAVMNTTWSWTWFSKEQIESNEDIQKLIAFIRDMGVF